MGDSERKPFTTDRQVTAFRVSGLPEGKKRARHSVQSRHGKGLFIEVRENRGTALWMYRFYLAGKQHEMMLGTTGNKSLAEARAAHADAVALVKEGIDPRHHRAARKAENLSAWTMAQAFERWIAFYATTPGRGNRIPTSKTVTKNRRRWEIHLSPLAAMYVRDVKRRHAIDVLEKAVSVAPVEARHTLNLLRMLLDYCEDREVIDENPIANLTPAKIGASAGKARERNLKMSELRDLWEAVDERSEHVAGLASSVVLSIPVGNAIRLLILTGCRRSEVAGMRWDEVRRETWTIPSDRAKSNREHKVHLSPLVLSILKEQREYSSGDYVFSSLRDEGRSIHPDSISTAISRLQGRSRKEHDESAPLYNLEPFTVHDLRRTAATQWTELLMADPLLVEMMLAHAPPKLMANYNRAQRWKVQVDIWNRWSAVVEGMATQERASNVVPLRG